MTQIFGVSRGVIGEAIRGLQVSVYVEIKQGPLGGAFVKEISLCLSDVGFSDLFFSNKLSITEVLNVRRFIEPEVARLAALNINDTYREKLETALKQEQQPFVSSGDLMDKLTAVHLILAEMCGNRLFEGILMSIISLTHRIIKTLLEDLLKLHGAGDHDEIVQTVIQGDAEAAARAMARHGENFSRVFLDLEQSEGWIWRLQAENQSNAPPLTGG